MHRSLETNPPSFTLARALSLLGTALVMSTASAQTDLIVIEFNEDDQPGFDIWPGGIGGSFMSNQFGAITVDVSTNTSFAQPTNRGSVNGNPPGFTYQHLYEDLLHAFTPTGTLTLDFSGLQPNQNYIFTLYAWDPGSTGSHEWTVTQGTAVPSVITVDWSIPLVDNNTFALVFDVTTTATGTFQVDNTAGLGGSAINGFRLSDVSLGTSYCSPAVMNSTGLAAAMSATGTSSVLANNLVLESSDMPQNAFAFFLTSDTQSFVTNPGGSTGNLCLGGAIGRYVGPGQIQNSGAAGAVSLAVDLTRHPTPTGLISVSAGETWNFQCWFRDTDGMGGATSNFSDGLEISFL